VRKRQNKSVAKNTLDRELNVIAKIEKINQELVEASERRKIELINQRRRLEAILDPIGSLSFYISCEIIKIKNELTTVNDRRKARLENKLRRLEALITSPKKEKALDDRRATIDKCLEGFKAGRTPTNHTKLIEWLRAEGALTAPRNPKTSTGRSKGLRSPGARGIVRGGEAIPVSDSTARDILRSTFGPRDYGRRKPGPKNV